MIGNSRTCSRRIYRPQEFNFTIKYELPTPLPPVARIWASRRVVTFRLLQRGPALAGQVIDSTRSIQFSMQRRTPLAAAAFWLLLQQLSLIWPGSCRRLLTECRSIARRGYCIWAGVKIFNGRPVVLLSRLLLAMCRQQLLREIFQTRLLSCSCGLFKGGELVMTGKPYNRNREQHSPCASGSPNV